MRFAFKYSSTTIKQKSSRAKDENVKIKNGRMMILVKTGWWLHYYAILFLCMYGFSLLKSEKRKRNGGVKQMNFPIVEVLERWDKDVQSNWVIVEKKVPFVFLTY